jgi:hypothetical protein
MGVSWCCDSSMAMNNHTTTWTSSTLKLDDLLKTRRNFEECVKFPKIDIESRDESLTNRTSDHWNRLRDTKSEGKQILHMTINKWTWGYCTHCICFMKPRNSSSPCYGDCKSSATTANASETSMSSTEQRTLWQGVIQKLQGSMEDHKIKNQTWTWHLSL